MSVPLIETLRHKASIAGRVIDAVTGLPIPKALVVLTGKNKQTETREDGFFYFMDQRAGSYTLTVTAPLQGNRYGTFKVSGISVQNASDGRPKLDAKATISLSPTRVAGFARQSSDGLPIKGALIQLLGSETKTVTDKDGKYILSGIKAGSPNVQASAQGFVTAVQKAALAAGLETTMNFSLVKS